MTTDFYFWRADGSLTRLSEVALIELEEDERPSLMIKMLGVKPYSLAGLATFTD